jgi:hypothetical protein
MVQLAVEYLQLSFQFCVLLLQIIVLEHKWQRFGILLENDPITFSLSGFVLHQVCAVLEISVLPSQLIKLLVLQGQHPLQVT